MRVAVGKEWLMALREPPVNIRFREALLAATRWSPGDVFGDLIGHSAGSKEELGAFVMHKRLRRKGETPHLSLWSSDYKSQVKVLVEPTHYGVVYPGRKGDAEKQSALASDLFYQRSVRWMSQKILAAATAEPALGGSAWAPLRGGSEVTRFAFAVWANSIFGFVNHWAVGQRQQTGRTRAQIGAIRRIPCPDFTDLALTARAEAYLDQKEELFGLPLEPAVYADMDEGRRLDLAAADILGVPERNRAKTADWFAKRWTAEPKVRGNG